MHMADALISPAVGGTMWAITVGLIAWCARKVKTSRDDRLIPMMGVLGAFIFTAQMINFSIPATGSSGHLGGGLILAILLGPYAAFLVIASVLTVQALFFADGGLLALGCNVFNLGFFPAFITYPLLYKLIAGNHRSGARAWGAAMVAAIAGLQLGAFGVVLETRMSGISDLPFKTFVLFMQPIHLAIGIVEGLTTAAIVGFIARARPETLDTAPVDCGPGARSVSDGLPPVLIGLLLAAALLGGVASWFASTHPDGLEWAITKATGKEEVSGSNDKVHQTLAAMQSKTAFLPDYGFTPKAKTSREPNGTVPESWPAVKAGISVSGIVGGFMTLILAILIGFALKARRKAL
ncbi:MAG: energy-coupling factor ABC transporter permease [bacterium]